MGPLLLAAALGIGMGGFFRGPSANVIKHDPDRRKTPEDLEAMARAQAKRDRKAARALQNAGSQTAVNPPSKT